ncbi:40S ribosomal protein s7 [Phtheirospermum japonicum]|uniref:40S ribosomal protein s7 n=1 Tax=Phtheirospermum japonicum TaxID=374723 RepID=A0A830BY77_9LAMI|nr:40S ribosomal protein s7 [Phtheirospermum japonicum]
MIPRTSWRSLLGYTGSSRGKILPLNFPIPRLKNVLFLDLTFSALFSFKETLFSMSCLKFVL